jgi:hypothetical protein
MRIPKDFKRQRGHMPFASCRPSFETSRGTSIGSDIQLFTASLVCPDDARRLAAWLTEAADWLDEQNKKPTRAGKGKK